MIENVVFFNSWHFGDLHSNKEYVRQFIKEFEKLGINVSYVSTASPRAINLPIECASIYEYIENGLPSNPPTWYDPDTKTMYINTWVGYYIAMQSHNFSSQKEMWQDISTKIFVASNGQINIKIKDDPSFYVSDIDESLIVIPEIPEGRNVLVCNDIPISKQSFNGDWAATVNTLASEFKNTNFICTNIINSELENVYFTNILTNRASIGCDLPEIGYLAGHCDFIVTNSSGPGTFAMTKKVFFSGDKTVVAFVQGEGNAYWSGINNLNGDFRWHPVWDDPTVTDILRQIMMEKKYD
jgi:hypothetical protein